MKINKTLIMNMLPTLTGRQYTLPVLESMRDQINSRDKSRNIGTMGFDGIGFGTVSLSAGAFNYSNAVIEDGCLYCDIELLKTTAGDTIKDVLTLESMRRLGVVPMEGEELNIASDGIAFRPAGIGTVESQGDEQMRSMLGIDPKVVDVNEDYKLISIAAIPKNEDALVEKINKDKEDETEIL